jgi:nicotinamidase-related amidase
MILPIPDHFNPDRVSELRRTPYADLAIAAKTWATTHQLQPAATDTTRIGLLAIDVQNTFCLPDFELFVGGRSGTGAIDDTARLCRFVYQHLDRLTELIPTLDTHTARQIFHPACWRDPDGNPPAAMTTITLDDIDACRWQIDPSMAAIATNQAGFDGDLDAYTRHYVRQLTDDGKLPLTIWPYHSMLGGVGHALVPAFEEACFFHNIARSSQTRFELKGNNPLTENYSVLRPEVMTDDRGTAIATKNNAVIEHLLQFDAVIIAGQAKSHCVAWSIRDLLNEIQARDPKLAQRVYLLEDCMSPVVVPDVVDFTDIAETVFAEFAAAGMHRVTTAMPIETWPQFPIAQRVADDRS